MPGQPGGMHTLTGLAHDRVSHVAYDAEINEEGMRARSLKLAALQTTLKPPPVFGERRSGDLLRDRLGQHEGRDRGSGGRACATKAAGRRRCTCPSCSRCRRASSEIMQRFKRVMTIEGNWCDRPEDVLIDEDNRRYSALAMLLRSRCLVDVDCWSEVRGQPIKPSTICARRRATTLQLKGRRP